MSETLVRDSVDQAGFDIGDILVSTRPDGPLKLSSKAEPSIAERHKSLWKQGYGSVSVPEAQFLIDIIRHTNAKTVFEVGTATGLSGVLMMDELAQRPGTRFRTVDLDTTFWNDRTKASGWLIDEALETLEMDAKVHRESTARDAEAVLEGQKANVIFIDANHQHPWPMIDTFLSLPSLAPNGIMAHHDLKLFTLQDRPQGIGPKYLFDQLADSLRIQSDLAPNIFALHAPRDAHAFVERMAEGLLLPWSNRQRISDELIEHVGAFCEKHFNTSQVRYNLELGAHRYNTRP